MNAQSQKFIRSYGRRHGRVLKPSQTQAISEILPSLRIPLDSFETAALQPRMLFTEPVDEVWLEIGFGGGEHLATNADHRRNVGILGCEPFVNGVAKLVLQVKKRNLSNVRIHDGDVQDVLPLLADASISKIFLLFPDPWPKLRHSKRRFLNEATLSILARLLCEGGEFRFASDSDAYCRHVMELFYARADFVWTATSAADWSSPPADWVPTRYEAKALKAGRKCAYLRFMRCS